MHPYNPKCSFGTRPLHSRSGLAFPLVMALTLIMTVELASLGIYAANQMGQIRRNEVHMKAFYLAEASAQQAAGQIRHYINTIAVLPDNAALNAMELLPPTLANNYQVLSYTIDSGALDSGQAITSGNYTGLRADTQHYDITMQVKGPSANSPSATVRQEIQVQQIPVFQFGVFYDNDLEILPGAAMTFAGPVHTNSNLYLETSASLTFASGITTVGRITHGRKDSSVVATGNIFIKDSSNVDKNMKLDDGTWLDSNHEDWMLESQTRWSEKVKSNVHSTQQLTLPLPVNENLNQLIKRRDAADSASEKKVKMDYKAAIRLVDGTIKDKNGATIVFDYCSDPLKTVAQCTGGGRTVIKPIVFPSQTYSGTCNASQHFKDNRENKCMRTTEIDIQKLAGSPKYTQLMSQNPTGMVLFHSDLRNKSSATYRDALRLKNGATIPTKMTFASENPIYVQGDFNTTNKKNVGVIGDSMNILSNAWSDTNSTTAIGTRTASNTTVNAAVIAGNTETVTGTYNGGFENIHRFLEGWTGKTVTFSGSVAVLYNSAQATGNWGQGDVYSAPNRAWSYDTALSAASANVPGFPSVFNLTKGSWQQDSVGGY